MRDFIGVVEVAVEGFAEDPILIPVDVQGRRVAMGLRLDVVGSLGLLVRAKRAGLIRDVRPIMDAMLSWGLFASDSLYRRILAVAGELN